MGKEAAKEIKVPGSNPGTDFFLFFCACDNFLLHFFCANLPHASTQKAKLRKICKPYSKRNINAQSAHVAMLRRYCAKQFLAQFRRKIRAIRQLGIYANWSPPTRTTTLTVLGPDDFAAGKKVTSFCYSYFLL